mgnify:FL=1
MPEAWYKEESPRSFTRPHRRLMMLLAELGLRVHGEFGVGRYSLDVFCEDIWCGFEADGLRAHAGTRRRQHDEERDRWIYENAGIPVLRIQETALRRICWDEVRTLVLEFIERYAGDLAERKERGAWVTSQG